MRQGGVFRRWAGDNGPEQTDFVAVKNLVAALPKDLKRIIHVSSAGVDRSNQLPFSILNLFGTARFTKSSNLL